MHHGIDEYALRFDIQCFICYITSSFILHLEVFSVRFILCFFLLTKHFSVSLGISVENSKDAYFSIKTHLVVSAGEFLNKQGHFCKWILVFH